MIKKLTLLILLLIICISDSFAIHPIVRNFNTRTMKAGTQNWDIVQYKNDWMYFANNEGLLEFDGNRWTVFPIQNHTNVRSLFYDKESDRIFAGAFNEIGYYQRNEKGILIYNSLVSSINKAERNFNEIWTICKKEDSFIFQGSNEVFLYKQNSIKRYDFSNRINASGVVNEMYLLSIEKEGVLMQNGDVFIQLPNSEQLKDVKICAILPFGEKDILFVSDFNGLYIFNGERTSKYATDLDDFFFENQVFCADIKENKLAIGTVRNGVVVKNFDNNSTVFSNTGRGLQNNTVLSVKFDHQNNIWLGLDKGIDYVQINSPIYNLFGNSQQYGSGYASLVKKNLLYLGSNQGLYTTDFPLKNTPNPIPINLIPRMQGQVWSIREIDNQIFCGTDHGTFIIENKTAHKIEGVPGTWDFRQLKQHPDYILGSCYRGFFLLKKQQGKWKFSHFIKGFSDSGAIFQEDNNGNIWFSHWIKGISKLTFTDQMRSVYVEPFDTTKGFYTNRNNLLFKIDNRIIFPSDGGLFEYNSKENNIKHATDLEKYFGIYPTAIALHQTDNTSVWVITPHSVELASKKSDGSFQLDKTSFASLKNMLIPGFEQFNAIGNNNLIINTEDGFSIIDLTKRTNIEKELKVSIRDVYLTGKQDSLVGGFIVKQNEIPEFSFKNNSIRFEYIAPEYQKDVSVEYSCFLENYDANWSVFSSSNIKEYTKLPKGNYVFRVRAESNIKQDIAETSYRFSILAPWYESNLALFIYFCIVLLSLYLLYIFVKNKSEEGAREMQVKKEQEMREQEKRFLLEAKEKEKEIIELKNQRLKYDLRHKSQELASSTMNLIRKNEILLEISRHLEKMSKEVSSNETDVIVKSLDNMQNDIKKNIERDDNWKKFEANFDIVYENYLKRLGEMHPMLTVNDKKLCAYLKMGLSSKDIAPLMNMSFRSVEMSRYRLRKKLDLEREVNLTEYLQRL